MNPHFDRELKEFPRIPERSYAFLDHVEIFSDAEKSVLYFDLIDADWLDNKLASVPQGRGPGGRFLSAAHSWFRADIAERINPLGAAPLFRMEQVQGMQALVAGNGIATRSTPSTVEQAIGDINGEWIEFRCMQQQFPNALQVQIYPGLFAAPVTLFAAGKLVTAHKHKRLTAMHDLSFFPYILDQQVAQALAESRSAALAVYDVGQGNCNALLEPVSHTPTLYYDLGAGIYANHGTTPPFLRFCFTNQPTIVLSHWDADHWAGTYATSVGGKYPALTQKWIAPKQEVSTMHLAFAFDIWTSGNGDNLSIYDPARGAVVSTTNASGHGIDFWRGSGSGTNESGLVIEVNNCTSGTRLSWLLTGDCDYSYFPTVKKNGTYVGVVAPHHGADLLKTSPVPKGPANGYARLIYSMGKNNQHSGVSHPTKVGVTSHEKAGWKHAAPYLAKPGHSVPGNSIRATNAHFTKFKRGGVIVGWLQAPRILSAPCPGTCTIMPSKN